MRSVLARSEERATASIKANRAQFDSVRMALIANETVDATEAGMLLGVSTAAS
ncbi:MAG: hypothetical protein ACYDAY_02365 [Candidatus Dormibacteria bacterium]